MKNFYKVSNTIENGPRMDRKRTVDGPIKDRVKSRISPINHRLWTVIAPMLFVAFGLFGVNESAWATWPTYEGSGSTSGYVLNDACEGRTSAWTTYEFVLDLAGPGATLSFKAKISDTSVGTNLKIYQYVGSDYEENPIFNQDKPGKWSTGIWGRIKNTDYDTYSVPISPLATKIKFVFVGSLDKNIRNVSVTRYSDNAYALYNDSLDCGSADYNAANSSSNYTTGTANVDWSYIATEPTCTITGSNAKYFEIKSKSNKPATNKYGAMSIIINYKHTAPGDHFATLNVGGKTITIKGHTNKITPYIVTTPTVDTITYGQTISNSQLHGGLVKADLINNTGATVAGTWTIDENGQTVSTSGGQNATVHLTFTPSDQNTYNVIQTTQTMFVRSAATITWASAYSAEKPTIPVGKTIENAASTNANGATVTYSTSDPNVIVIENEGTTFRAIAEGEATITASHGVTATHGSASISKTFKTTYKDIQVIVWTDRFDRLTTEMTSKNLLAQVWIENPSTGVRTYSAARTALLEYSVGDNTVVSIPNNSTTLTIHKKGNTTLTASVEGDDQYESASVTMEVKVREPSAGCDDPLLLDIKNNGTNDYLYRLFSDDTKKPALYSDEYAINVAQGQVPDKLSFGHKGEEYKVVGLSFWTYYSGTIKAQQKVNGNWVDVENSIVTPEKSQWHTKEGVQLDERATHIRFVRPQGGEGYHYVKDVEVTMKHFIRTATPTVDFGNTIKVNSSEYQDVVINYSNAKGSLQVINPFTKDVTVSDDYIDIDECGDFGSATLRISFSPTTATEIDNYIVIKDPVIGNSSALSIRVMADVQRADQTITWNQETNISTIDQILLNGTTNGKEHGQMNIIGYEVTNNDGVISVTDGVVTILKPGTVTITASQPGTANYDIAELVKNFTISAEPLTLVAPTASDITYGQALPTLIGGSAKDSKGNDVDGTFTWQNPDAVLNAGNNQTPTVVFTPSTNAAWYTNLTTTANINVAKADPVVTVENVSFAYGTKAEEVALSGTGAGTWTWTDSRKGQVLAVDTYEMDVHFAPKDDANYNAIDKTITLTVTRANPAATVENVSFAYGTKAEDVALSGTGAGTWTWTDSRKGQTLTVGEYEMDVHFAPTDDANYNTIDTKITLTVTKANPAATVENVSFAYGTKAEDVALSGTGAGTWTWTDSRKGQTLTVGEYEMDVHFAPTDDANYNTIDTKITLTVTKANPVATASAVEITYGATASSVDLEGTGVAGTWNWTDTRKDDVLAAGSYTMNVHFKPTDLTNYNEKDATVALTVKKATTTLSWTSNPTDLAYNATDAVYTATSASDGAITYSIISGGSYAHIHANTGALTIDLPGNTITIQAEQAEGTNYSAPTAITVEVTIAAAPVGPNSFTGNGEWENPSNWSTGIVPTTAEPDIIVVGQLVINEEKTIGGLTIMPTGGVTIVDNGTLTVNGTTADQSGYGDLYVANGGEVEVAGSLTVRDLIVEASIGTSEGNAESGQVASAENIVYTNAYIDINMDPSGFMDDTKWYGFTVPFAVDAYNGVSRKEGTAFRQCVYGTDYLIAEYDANKRLNSGNGWKFISGSTLNAGQFYFLTVDGSYNTYRFKASGNSYTPAAAASLYVNGSTTNYDANWNGVGNSTLQHVTASYTDGEYVQVYMNGQDAYKTVNTNDATFVVGCPFFVQAKVVTTLALNVQTATTQKYYAPRRAQEESTDVVRINLSATDGGYSDQIYFSAVDKEQDAYIIGQDLAKAGVSTVVPQLWMAQYNQKLSVHEATWNGDRATCPLGIYVPKNGEYVLTATQPEDGTQIYLTENGAPIWDLTMLEYVLSLEKGNTSSYGLMIVRAPQVTTGVEDIQGTGAEVRKVIIDNTMYIITPEGTMFNVIGKKVQ